MLANQWRAEGSPVYTPRMIHPYYPDQIPGATEPHMRGTPDNIDALCQVIVSRHAERQ